MLTGSDDKRGKRQRNLLPHHHGELMAPGGGDRIRSTFPMNGSTTVQDAGAQTDIDGPLWDRIWATWQSSALLPANDGQGRLLAISRSQPPPPAPISKRISVVEKALALTDTDCKLRNSWPNVSDHVEVDARFEKWLAQQKSLLCALEALRRCLGLLPLGDGLRHNDVAILVTLHNDVIADVRSLPQLDPKYSWSRKMACGEVSVFVPHLHVQTVRGQGHQERS